ncbi:hypothetical protein D3C71_1513260 [compost metagenome]
MPHFVAHHILTRLQQRHILFEAGNIHLQLFKSHRQPLITKIKVLTGILRVIQQLMRGRSQRIQRGISISGIDQLADRLFK